MIISAVRHQRMLENMCKGLDHGLQVHLIQCPGIIPEYGLQQANLLGGQFQHCSHPVPEGYDQRHQEHSNQVSQSLILRRHQSNSTTWPRLSAPTAAKILDGSRVPPVADSHDFPTDQKPASRTKTQTQTQTQLPANSFHLLLSLQLIDRLLAAESPIPRFPYRLLRALLGICQDMLQLDLSRPVAPILFSLKDSVSRELERLRAGYGARTQGSMRMSGGRLNGRSLLVLGSIIMIAPGQHDKPGTIGGHRL